MNRRHLGHSVTETAIIIAVIAIVVILAVSILGKEINSTFTITHKEFKGYQPFGPGESSTPSYKGGDLGGTSSNPVSQCSEGVCAIDYGDFALSGLPENFGEFVETAGTSGGTDQLFDLMAQLAEQIKDKDESDGNIAEDFKLIANLGHFSADIQEVGEKAAKECASASDPKACFNQKSNTFKPSDIPISEDLQKILTRWPTPEKNTGYSVDSFQQILGKVDLGMAKSGYARYTDLYPSLQIMQAYDRIKAADEGDGVTPEMKEIATALIKQVDTLNDNLQNIYFKTQGSSGQWSNYDPITGRRKWDKGTGSGDITDVYAPKTSTNTDIRGVLFCATGNGTSNGYSCR